VWLARHAEEFAEAGALVVAVSVDDVGAAAALTENLELPFPVLSDPGGEGAIRPFGVWSDDEDRARPALVAFAPDGREIYRYVGSDQADRGREEEALAALRALKLPPLPAPSGVHPHADPRPTAKAYPRRELYRHFYGVRSAANVLHLRTGHEQAARLRELAEGYMEALEEPLTAAVKRLLAATRASRVTLRQDLPGEYAYPVTHEALAPKVPSLRTERTVDLRTQPVVAELRRGRQVVQNDCRAAYADPAFQRMLETYGGLAAQIVTPVFRDGRLAAIVSVHQLGEPRSWTDDEAAAASRAADEVASLL
jgi:hypothetical protein